MQDQIPNAVNSNSQIPVDPSVNPIPQVPVTPTPTESIPVATPTPDPVLTQTQAPAPVSAQTPSGNKASDILSSFAQENFSEVQKVIKFVKQGYKLDNAAMQQLLLNLKTKHNMDYRDLLAVYLTLDKAVESGALTNDLIDYMKQNPQSLEKFEDKE